MAEGKELKGLDPKKVYDVKSTGKSKNMTEKGKIYKGLSAIAAGELLKKGFITIC